jgi:hypothetical protein
MCKTSGEGLSSGKKANFQVADVKVGRQPVTARKVSDHERADQDEDWETDAEQAA